MLLEALEPEEGVHTYLIAHTWHQCVMFVDKKNLVRETGFFFAYLVQ